jgi:hypothetical protein
MWVRVHIEAVKHLSYRFRGSIHAVEQSSLDVSEAAC